MLVHHGPERLKGRKFATAARRADLVITTYALAVRDREALAEVKWGRVALDEAQSIKTVDTKQTNGNPVTVRPPPRGADRDAGREPAD